MRGALASTCVRSRYRDRPTAVPLLKPTTMPLPTAVRCVFLVLALGASVMKLGAAELSPDLQNKLDLAVIEHASGRFDAARLAFESLAKQNVPAAQFNLAVMHLQKQVRRPNVSAARKLLDRAARGGFVTAQVMLARSLENGDLGPRNLALAHRWYLAAAQAGDLEAQLAMGTAHFLGRGVKKDSALAASWFREAAKAGDVGAMYLLASMYEQGDGLHSDLRLARYWYDAAAKAGDPAAPGKIKEVDEKMTAVKR
jgi:uncharacterized protein